MTVAFKSRQLLVSDESSFAEYILATGSLTWEKNLPALEDSISVRLEQAREPDMGIQSRLAKKALPHKGVRKATLTFSQPILGHISDPTGALTETHQQQLLGDGLGGNSVSQAGGLAAGGGSATSLAFGSGTLVKGGIVRVGVPGDGRAEGHPTIVNGTTTAAALLTALPAAAALNDVIRAAQMAYHVEGATLTTKRFCVMHRETGAQFVLFGCQLAGLRYVTPIGGKGVIEFTYECAYWETVARSFPDALAIGSMDCAPISGGGILIQDVGTTTRTVKVPAELTINVMLGLSPQVGTGGAPYQYIQGWNRDGFDATLEVALPWETTWQTLWDTENPSITKKQILWWANTGNGRSYGVVLRNAMPAGDRPIAPYNVNGQLYVKALFQADEHTDTTNDLTRASFVHWSC